jgi:hypothetical protein
MVNAERSTSNVGSSRNSRTPGIGMPEASPAPHERACGEGGSPNGGAWWNERGLAVVLAMFMTLVLSVLGTSVMFIGRTETLSSLNYTTMSQARYAAESGVHAAANYLLHVYVAPVPAGAVDPLGNYDFTVTPVLFNNQEVVLSSDPGVPSNYPAGTVRDAFVGASQGTLNVTNGIVMHEARARLLSMRELPDPFGGIPVTLQTWEITGVGRRPGAGSGSVEVSAIIERKPASVFQYAAFATANGCDALQVGGGGSTHSYDSTAALDGNGVPVSADTGGNVGTNGNLGVVGTTTVINGTLSTPRAGVGDCTSNNVTAATFSGNGQVTEGLVELPQAVEYPTPEVPSPLPPTTSVNFNQCGTSIPDCSASGSVYTLTPTGTVTVGGASMTGMTLGNVSLTGSSELRLTAGTYVFNSLKLAGQSTIVLDGPGPVIVHIVGQDETMPLDLTGGGVTNPSFDPSKLQFIYAGDGDIRVRGGSQTAALIYAPNASAALTGGSSYYGALVAKTIKDMGGVAIHYDTNLDNSAQMAGRPMMSGFTWRTF